MSADVEAVLSRMEAALRLIYPEHITPQGKRVLDSVIADVRVAPSRSVLRREAIQHDD